MSSENGKRFLDIGVLEINLKKISWISENEGHTQFEEPANGSVCRLTAEKPLNQQKVGLPEGYISAALFFSYFPEEVFKEGPAHPDWYKTFAETAMELAVLGRMPNIGSLPD